MNNHKNKKSVLETFQRALDQSAFVLKENPELTFPQIYNRAQWKKEKNELLKKKVNIYTYIPVMCPSNVNASLIQHISAVIVTAVTSIIWRATMATL